MAKTTIGEERTTEIAVGTNDFDRNFLKPNLTDNTSGHRKTINKIAIILVLLEVVVDILR